MISPLTEALARQAYLRGLLGSTSAQAAYAATPQPQPQQASARVAQQAGGHASKPGTSGQGGGLGSLLGSVAGAVFGGPLWSLAGGAIGGLIGGGSNRQRTATRTSLSLGQQYPALGEQFQYTLGSWLGGQSGLPPAYYQEALARGMAGINQQAQYSRQNLMATLGQRGLLNSGAVVSGMSDIERGRLGSMAQYYGTMQEADINRRQEALLNAMQIMAGSREQAAASQAAREQIRMQQPTTWDYLAQLAGAAAPYFMGSQQDYMSAVLAAMNQSQQPAAPVTTSTGWRSPLPPGYGEYIYGRA